MYKLLLAGIVFVAVAALGLYLFSGASMPSFFAKAQPTDLGVPYSDEALERFNQKIGSAPNGIMAGGIPVGDSFTSQEATSFLRVFLKKQKAPVDQVQVRFHEGFFEMSGVIAKPARGDILLKGSIEVRGPQDVVVVVQSVQSHTIAVSETLRATIEGMLNKGIRDLVATFAPDENFLSVQTLQLHEDALLVEGVFPQEFFPDSKIRF